MNKTMGFQPGKVVEDPAELFGRTGRHGTLDLLVTQLRMGTSSQLLGERRSGKTSILRCACSVLNHADSRCVPVYLNFRDNAYIHGVAACYKYIIGKVMDATECRKGAVGAETSTLLGANPALHDLETIQALDDSRVYGVFERLLAQAASKSLRVILLIDEYEHLLKQTFAGEPGAFGHLRWLSSQPGLTLSFAVAGRTTWMDNVGVDGSPELNTIGPLYFVPPLERGAFGQMWEHCVASLDAVGSLNLTRTSWDADRVFAAVGGWPFYGKLVGQLLASGDVDEDHAYDALRPHFEHVWHGLNIGEREALLTCARGHDWGGFDGEALVKRGLLVRDSGELIPCGRMWQTYLNGHKRSRQGVCK